MNLHPLNLPEYNMKSITKLRMNTLMNTLELLSGSP